MNARNAAGRTVASAPVGRPSITGAWAIAAALALVLVGVSPAAAATAGAPSPDACAGSRPDRPERCVGPVVDASGGGGDAVTIVVSVLVGLAVAGVAFVVLRRQLSRGASS